jgi:hypothetical protein
MSDMPSFDPKMLITGIPNRSWNPATIAGASGAEPEPIARRLERSTCASSASFWSNVLSTAGGAIVKEGRSVAIWAR